MTNVIERRRNKRRRERLQADRAAANMKDDDVIEAEAAKEMAAALIARRLVLDISDEKLVERLGRYDITQALQTMKAGEKRDIVVYREARRIERDLLTDGRLTTFQRYARIVGLRIDLGIESNAAARQRRRKHWSAVRLARHIRTQRRYLANKYGKVRVHYAPF